MQLFKTDFKNIEVYKIIESLDNKYCIYIIIDIEQKTTITWLVFDQYYYLTNTVFYNIPISHLHLYTPLSTVEKDKILLIIQGLLLLETIRPNSFDLRNILGAEYNINHINNTSPRDRNNYSDSYGHDYGYGSGSDHNSGAGSDISFCSGSGCGNDFSYGNGSGSSDGDGDSLGVSYGYGGGHGEGYGNGHDYSCPKI